MEVGEGRRGFEGGKDESVRVLNHLVYACSCLREREGERERGREREREGERARASERERT